MFCHSFIIAIIVTGTGMATFSSLPIPHVTLLMNSRLIFILAEAAGTVLQI